MGIGEVSTGVEVLTLCQRVYRNASDMGALVVPLKVPNMLTIRGKVRPPKQQLAGTLRLRVEGRDAIGTWSWP